MDLKVVKDYKQADMAAPDKIIKRMESSWQGAYRNTQLALVATLVDCHLHGDKPTAVARANRIVDCVSKGGNVRAIVEWFTRMGFVVGENAFVEAPDRKTIEEISGKAFKNAKELMWWSLKPQKAFEGWSLSAALNKAMADAVKFQQMSETDPESAEKIDIPEELLAGLRDLVE